MSGNEIDILKPLKEVVHLGDSYSSIKEALAQKTKICQVIRNGWEFELGDLKESDDGIRYAECTFRQVSCFWGVGQDVECHLLFDKGHKLTFIVQ